MQRVSRSGGFIAIGLVLILVGVTVLVIRQLGADLIGAVVDAGWPLLVILPGFALLIASLLSRSPDGLGLAIAGAVVTTVGAVLWYQDTTGHWESWAYAWTLVGIGAPGLALLVYGLAFHRRDLWVNGLRFLALAAVLFVAGFWFFETLFRTGRVPVDVTGWWPVALIALGLLTIGAGAVRRRPGSDTAKT
jgi:hypothetical protein